MKEANYWNNKENCLAESKKYKTIGELQKGCYGCYVGLKKNKWLAEAFPGYKQRAPNGYWDIKENCLEECKNHDSITKVKKYAHGCYCSIKKHGWEKDMQFKEKQYEEREQVANGYWNTKENCFAEAKKYSSAYELQRNRYGCYVALKRNGWLLEAYPPKESGMKPMNYWKDKEKILNAASECSTKMEFKRKHGGAFVAAVRYGWMEEISSGFNKTIKYMNLEDEIHCIYVYEINEFKACYVGRTTNLHSRDLSHRRGRKHHDGSITYDGLYTFCKKHGVEIPAPIIKEEKLNGEQSLIREDYWVNEYKNNGWNVINVAKTGRLSGSLGAIKKWTYEECKEFAKDYEYKTDLKKANYCCYDMCLKNGWFEEFGIKDKRPHPNGYWSKLENVLNAAKQCTCAKDMLKKFGAAYNSARKHNWIELLEYGKEENA